MSARATVVSVVCTASIMLLGSACSENRLAQKVEPQPEVAQNTALGLAAEEVEIEEAWAALGLKIDQETESEPAGERKPALVRVGQTALKEAPLADAAWKASLTRGARVEVVGQEVDGHLQAVLADGSTGYVAAGDVIVGQVEELLAFESSPFFERPDSTSLPRLTVAMGTTIYAVDSRGPWVEVVLPTGERGWMLSLDLAREPDELQAARS